jgi:hypothetical protein
MGPVANGVVAIPGSSAARVRSMPRADVFSLRRREIELAAW